MDNSNLISIFTNIALVINLMSCILFAYSRLFRVKKAIPFGIYLFVAFAVNLTANILGKNGVNNMPLLHFFTFVEFGLLSLFYLRINELDKGGQRIMKYIIVIAASLILLNSIFVQNIYTFNSYSKTIANLVLLSFSIWHFYIMSKREAGLEMIDKSILIINAGLLIYFSSSLFIFMTGDLLNLTSKVTYTLWTLNSLLYLIFQIVVLVSLWKIAYPRIRYSP